jgi:hypothetical protein
VRGVISDDRPYRDSRASKNNFVTSEWHKVYKSAYPEVEMEIQFKIFGEDQCASHPIKFSRW